MNQLHNLEIIRILEKFKNNFILEQKATNKSKHTIKSYSNTILSFFEYLSYNKEELLLNDLKRRHIIEFLDFKENSLEKQGSLSPNSKKLYLTHLKIFFSYLENESSELYDFSKILDINIAIPKRTPKGLSKSDKDKLLNFLEEQKNENLITSYRNSLLIKLMLLGGLRREEVRNIELSDFILSDSLYALNIIGKGNKEREIFLNKHFIDDELDFLRKHKINKICVTKTGKNMDGSQIYRMVQSIYKKLNIKASVHDLRHTFAKTLADEGKDITVVQQLLGHNSINTTSIYLTPTKDKIKDTYLKVFYN